MSEPKAPWLVPDWRDRAPAMLRDIEGPNGEPCSTHFDRRWLWRLEGFLSVLGTTEAHREMRHDLYQYLCLTCEHVWSHYAGDDMIPEHWQCTWCNLPEWEDPT
jgi:hypothetical protein